MKARLVPVYFRTGKDDEFNQQLNIIQGLLTEEADILVRVRVLVMEIIAVDEFEPEDLQACGKMSRSLDTQHAA